MFHFELGNAGPEAIHYIMGDSSVKVKFPLSSFLRLEERENGNDEAEVSIDPTSISFPPNKRKTSLPCSESKLCAGATWITYLSI